MPEPDLIAEGCRAAAADEYTLVAAAYIVERLDELEETRTRNFDLERMTAGLGQLAESLAKKLERANLRINELTEQAAVPMGLDWMTRANRDSMRALLDTVAQAHGEPLPVPWRCMATTSMANAITDDHRAVWCLLPNGHNGMHHGELEGHVDMDIVGLQKVEPIIVDWSDVREAAGQTEVSNHA